MQYMRQDALHFYIRFINAAAGSEPVDIYANNNKVADHLRYAEFTDYLKGHNGNYDFQVLSTGSSTDGLEEEVVLDGSATYTLALIGSRNKEIFVIPDIPKAFDESYAHIRFIHLSQDCPSVNIFLDEQNTLDDLLYKEASGYVPVTPGRHSLTIYPIRSKSPILIEPFIALKSGRHYTAYLVGSPGKQSSLQVMIPPEGETLYDLY